MNERIKSLIERAEYQAQKQSGSDWEVHVEPSREQIFEKFAELIVRECASKAWFAEQYGIGDGTPVSKQIKEHFGVEE
jgi:hypothetical protein